MYLEYCNYNKHIDNYDEELQNIFYALEKGVNGLAIPICLMNHIKEIIPEDIKIATPIDYPCGYSATKSKYHIITNSIQSGADIVDYVPNHYLLKNKFKELSKEISGCLEICKKYDVQFRLLMSHLKYSDMLSIAKLYQKIGVETFFPSLGYNYNDPYENILACKCLKKDININCIFNGYINSKEHVNMLKKAKPFGIRLYNLVYLKDEDE